jgi:hypothetical protein
MFGITKLVLLFTFILLIPILIDICGSQKRFCLPHEFSDGGHDEHKVLNETTIKTCHTIKHLYLVWICRYMHVNYGLYVLEIQ